MLTLDPAQQRALALDPERHARILGAPGTGKTAVLVRAYAAALALPGWEAEDVLAIGANRLVSAALRAAVERAADRAIGGTPVRTPASLAFAILGRSRALAGEEAWRLLTGTAEDEAIAAVVERGASAGASIAGIEPEVLITPVFRGELRELRRILDDFGLEPEAFGASLAANSAAADIGGSGEPEAALDGRWREGLRILEAVNALLAEQRPAELSSSALLRAAAIAVRAEGGTGEHAVLRVPRLLLVDDAQELGEGELALLAACAAAGSRIWAYGDPDLSTSAFHGERTLAMARLDSELARKSWSRPGSEPASESEQLVVLEHVHRHGAEVRGLVQNLTRRIGAAGAGAQRAAESAAEQSSSAAGVGSPVQFAVATSAAEQLGIIAHRLRARHLGLGGADPVPWDDMAVVCRSRSEATRVARQLALHQVPTGIAAGGIVLREHRLVHELVALLRHALGLHALTPEEVLALAGGVIGGLDPVAVRRLRGALLLHERRLARAEGRDAAPMDSVIGEAFAFPGVDPVIDSRGGRALRRVALVAGAGAAVHAAGGTPREVLWALWDGAKLASSWQEDALGGRGARADEANRSLDAALALFFALQRHEEQDSEQPIGELLDELLASAVPEDTLARRAAGNAVTITTPQGAIGREFGIVAVVGLQDGAWPNLRTRGSLLGTAALERMLQGGEALPPSRKDTMHDELRLLAQSVSRATRELLVVAIADEDEQPSPFFRFGAEFRVADLPSSRLTLRGATAQARRALALDLADPAALAALVALAGEGVPGAHPDEWYGGLPPSTDAPLTDLEGDKEAAVSVSPSQLEKAEDCPLNWAIGALGGGTGGVQASLGTLVHHAFETVQDPDAERLFAVVEREWEKLPFDAEWESARARDLARAMTQGLAAYLAEFASSDRVLVGREARFSVPVERALLRGSADRLERRETADGGAEVTVLDLKTGGTAISAPAAQENAQLQAYQLGVMLGAFASEADGAAGELPAVTGDEVTGGARLLYVHPKARAKNSFVERSQAPMSDDMREHFAGRVAAVARIMAAGTFDARVEHHCTDQRANGACGIHIIPAVSQA